jgi:hypothetical protein
LTFPSFKRHVLDELNADLALALAIDENYDYTNRYWQHAKYRWTSPDFRDYGEAYDLAQGWLCQQHQILPPDWRSTLRIKGMWQGGIQAADPQPSASSILPFCRWLLLNGLQKDKILERYDRFVITRSDFVWLCPHPPLSILDGSAIWVPNGEDYGGINDRHLVASRDDVVSCLNVIEDIVLNPIEVHETTRYQPDYRFRNNELFFAHHLGRKALRHKVKRFPYVMYLARSVNEERSTWSPGRYEPVVGHYVKYDGEFRAAFSYAKIIHSRADWENGTWRQFDPTLAPHCSEPLARRLWYASKSAYVRAELGRPGHIRRFMRLVKRMARR